MRAPNGRVTSYVLNLAPTVFALALARSRQELPDDARLLWSTQLSSCFEAEFQSITLADVLGDGMINISFDDAATADATPITEEIFGTYDAPTPASAPSC